MKPQENRLKIISKKEQQDIFERIKKQFGISEVKGVLMKRGAERIFLYQGEFSETQIKNLQEIAPVERAGIYFAKLQNEEVRLSIDAIHLLQNQITKNIFELNQKQAQEFLHGKELNIETNFRGFIILKYKNDFIGTGKSSENKVTNFVPKNRRLKEKI